MSLIYKFIGVILLLFLVYFSKGQNCGVTINLPQDITICNPQAVTLQGNMTGNYLGFEWFGTDGFYTNSVLSPSVYVGGTTTYTLRAFGQPGTNLIINGDFGSGNVGFTSDYNYMPDIPGSNTELWNEGTYSVVSNPNFVHSNFSACSDHTGGGNMMVVNGASGLQEVWCQTVTVQPNKRYLFRSWAASVNPFSPARLQFSIDGVLVGNIMNLTSTTCLWQEFYAIWDANGNTSANICITNQNTAQSGNDFALDDIFFGEVCEEEEDINVILSEFDLLPESILPITCHNPQVALTVNVVPSTTNVIYNWYTSNGVINGSTNSPSINVEEGGTYYVQVTDQNGCTDITYFDVTADNAIPIIEIQGSDTIDCTNATIVLTAYPNTFVNDIIWTLPDKSTFSGYEIDATEHGVYTVQATAQNGCIGSQEHEIFLGNSTFVYTLSKSGDLNCSQDEVYITSQIFSVYDSINWFGDGIIWQSPDKDTIKVVNDGIYRFQIFLGEECSYIDSIRVYNDLPSFEYLLSASPTLTCNLEYAWIYIDSTYNVDKYRWRLPDGQIVSEDSLLVRVPGSYTIEMFDINGCVTFDSIQVLEERSLPIYRVEIDTIDCLTNSGGFNILPEDDYTYSWLSQDTTYDTQNISVSTSGFYFLEVVGQNGCIKTDTLFLPSSIDFPIISVNIDTINCINPTSSSIITTNIPSTITWDNNIGVPIIGNIITTTVGGEFSIEATSILGCKSTIVINIPIDTIRPYVTVPNDDMLTCLMKEVRPVFTANNYTNAIWYYGNSVFSNELVPLIVKGGIYTLELSNPNGCTREVTYKVRQDTTKPNFTVLTPLLTCRQSSGTVALLSLEPYDYYIDGIRIDSNYFIVNSVGEYTIEAINRLGCVQEQIALVSGNFNYHNLNLQTTRLDCNNPSLWLKDVNFSNNIKYRWLLNGNSIYQDSLFINAMGEVILYAENSFGCVSETTVMIESNFEKPIILTTGDQEIKCNASSTSIIVNSNLAEFEVLWNSTIGQSGISKTIVIDQPTILDIEVVNPMTGCKENISLPITKQESPNDLIFTIIHPKCFGDQGWVTVDNVVGGDAPYALKILQNNILSGQPFSVLPGNHIIDVIDNNGCTYQKGILVEKAESFFVDAGQSKEIKLGTSTIIESNTDLAAQDIGSYNWMPATSLSCSDCPNPVATPYEDTEYQVVLTDKNGCQEIDQVFIRVKIEKGYVAPNIIQKGANANNSFTIYGLYSSVSIIKHLNVYDRWGNLVFFTKNITPGDPELGWDGSFFGVDASIGVYTWTALILYTDGEEVYINGDVTLIH